MKKNILSIGILLVSLFMFINIDEVKADQVKHCIYTEKELAKSVITNIVNNKDNKFEYVGLSSFSDSLDSKIDKWLNDYYYKLLSDKAKKLIVDSEYCKSVFALVLCCFLLTTFLVTICLEGSVTSLVNGDNVPAGIPNFSPKISKFSCESKRVIITLCFLPNTSLKIATMTSYPFYF